MTLFHWLLTSWWCNMSDVFLHSQHFRDILLSCHHCRVITSHLGNEWRHTFHTFNWVPRLRQKPWFSSTLNCLAWDKIISLSDTILIVIGTSFSKLSAENQQKQQQLQLRIQMWIDKPPQYYCLYVIRKCCIDHSTFSR